MEQFTQLENHSNLHTRQNALDFETNSKINLNQKCMVRYQKKKYNHEPELEIRKLQFDTKSQLDPYLVF